MSDDNFGKSMFTAEQLEQEKQEEEQRKREFEEKLRNGFFQHGVSRRVVIDNFTEEDAVGKDSGKAYKKPTYWLRDVETGQTELVDVRNHAFAFRNGMHDVKHELGTALKLGVTVLEVLTEADGEREFNGIKSPIWKFTVSLHSQDGKAPAPKPVDPLDAPIDPSSVPF